MYIHVYIHVCTWVYFFKISNKKIHTAAVSFIPYLLFAMCFVCEQSDQCHICACPDNTWFLCTNVFSYTKGCYFRTYSQFLLSVLFPQLVSYTCCWIDVLESLRFADYSKQEDECVHQPHSCSSIINPLTLKLFLGILDIDSLVYYCLYFQFLGIYSFNMFEFIFFL